jgi:hypothetical protein
LKLQSIISPVLSWVSESLNKKGTCDTCFAVWLILEHLSYLTMRFSTA